MRITYAALLLIPLLLTTCSQCPRSIDPVPDEGTGRISGVVVDTHYDEPLIGATVIVLDTSQGTFTRQHGRFTIENTPSGIYTVKVLMMGYAPEIRQNVVVKPNQTTELTFELKAIPVEVIPPITIERQAINITD